MARLFIAEKPELARAIVEGLDGGSKKGAYYQCGEDKVTWCIGHMLELCEPADFDPKYKKWNLEDLPIRTPVKYKSKANTAAQLKAILSLIKNAETIVHAGDNDSEGQLIVDELLEYSGFKGPVLRFMTNDNSTKMVKKSLANMTNNTQYYSLYQSALARNLGDQLYGFNMSRAYTVSAQTQGHNGVLSVGRVQTPILGLVVNRDRAHSQHTKAYYFDVMGDFTVGAQSFPAKYLPTDNAPTDDKNRLNDSDFAGNIAAECRGKPATISNLDSSIKESAAPLPYSIVKLQSDAARIFNYKPDQVMKITQELREKYRLITYNGTDCQYLNEEQHADAKAVLSAIAKTANKYSGLVEAADTTIKSRAFNNANVSAHHAIIPTETVGRIDDLPEALRNIYLLIAKRYIAQFYPKHQYLDTKASLDVSGHPFSVRSKITKLEGWKSLYSNLGGSSEDDSGSDEECISLDLSALSTGDAGLCDDAKVLDKETKPPALYTMSTLLNDLTRVAKYVKNPEIKKLLIDKDKDRKGEHGGIGTSRTRDQIIKKLFDLGFIAEKGKKVISTELGGQFFDSLPEIATSPDMTALWHEQQSMIEHGDNTCTSFVDGLMGFIAEQVISVKENGVKISVDAHKCPTCKTGNLRLIRTRGDKDKKTKASSFWGCSGYPECKQTVPDKAGKPDFRATETHDCPECNNPMKRIKGKYGFFWPCRSCNINYKDKRGKPDFTPKNGADLTEHECGQCKKKLQRRVSKKGSGKTARTTIWYGCSGFPSCKQTYFDRNGEPAYV